MTSKDQAIKIPPLFNLTKDQKEALKIAREEIQQDVAELICDCSSVRYRYALKTKIKTALLNFEATSLNKEVRLMWITALVNQTKRIP